MMSKMVAGLFSAGLVTSGMLAAPASAGTQAPDTTPPAVSAEPVLRYVVGTQVDDVYVEDHDYPGNSYSTYGWINELRWKASDASGICAQEVYEAGYSADPGGDWYASSISPSLRSLKYNRWDMDEGRSPSVFYLRVTDCAGNVAESNIARVEARFIEDTDPAIRYSSYWKTAYFSGFGSGSTHATKTKGASLTATVRGSAVALVMEKSADRGAVDVLVDGKQVATVDTYSATTVHRAVVWQRLLTPGTHTLKVVNRATAGRPRVDIDVIAN